MLICQLLSLQVATWLLQHKKRRLFSHRSIVLAPVPVADVTEEQDVGLANAFLPQLRYAEVSTALGK
jgi:hypothetical protein